MTSRTSGHAELRSVSKQFDGKIVLKNCTLDIKPGVVTGLIGPSGCGKSTIIDLIAGYETADEGEILLDGKRVWGPSSERLAVFQETALFPWKSTLSNVMFGPRNNGAPKAETQRKARLLLNRVGLTGFEEKFPNQLSGGMQRRAELARALINNPKIMLLDEPFRGLDALTRELLQEFLIKLYEEDPITTVFVTTEIEEAIFLCDRIVVLSNSPASVKKVVEVDFPRPRNFKMLSTQRFAEIQTEILGEVLEEARKTLGEGVNDAAEMMEAIARAVRDRSDTNPDRQSTQLNP
jgi:NitT/TauT family transport system ATP-binding protein